jgi:hypothetical protein
VFPLRVTTMAARAVCRLCPDKMPLLPDKSTPLEVNGTNTCVGSDGKVLSEKTLGVMNQDIESAVETATQLFQALETHEATEKECKPRCELTPKEALQQKIKDMTNDVLSATDVVIVEPDGVADCKRLVYVPFTKELFEVSKRAGKGCVTKASIGTLMPRVRLGSRTLVVGSPEFLTALDREATDVLDTLTNGELQKLLAKEKTTSPEAAEKEAAVLGGPLAQVLHVMFGWELSHIYDSKYMSALFNAGIKVSTTGCKSGPRKNLLAAALALDDL